MSHFLLVHCGFAGGWTWRAVADRLQAAGHVVHAPTLTGLGERAHLARPETDLDTHVQDLLGVAACEEAGELSVVASSSGAMAATGFADRWAGRPDGGIRRLVYVDTLVPNDGQSWLDLVGPEVRAVILDLAQRFGDGWRVPRSDVAPPRWVPQPLHTVDRPLRLDGAAERLERHFVHCTARPPGWFFGLGPVIDAQAERCRAAGWPVHELPSDHLPMLSQPDALAALLLAIERDAAPASAHGQPG